MANFDWHAERTDLANIALLDRIPKDEDINLKAVRLYRLARVRTQMALYDIDAVILSDAVNIRYATGARNMQVFTSRNPASRYLLLTANRSILFEFSGCQHLGEGYETIDEVRASKTASFTAAGSMIDCRENSWAMEMAELITKLVGPAATLGLERLNANVAIALRDMGFKITDAQKPVEMARAIKSAEEVKCIVASLRATENAVFELQEAIRPGMTENAVWATMHRAVIEQNCDYIETRLLSSGKGTNPWFQETSARKIEENVLVAIDTDVVGCYGYYSDFSRTFHAGPDKPTAKQGELYKASYEQLNHNISILKAGLTFREYASLAWPIPEKYRAQRYFCLAHGCGMTGEYPYLYHHDDYPEIGYDGVIEPGMTLCVESYIGEDGGIEGVKLEQQVLVTETGIEILSQFPFEEELLA